MTRINHFNLYECSKCQQIHIKPEYSSISLYMGMPRDAHYAPTDLKVCQKCGEKSSFSEYIPAGHMKPREFKERRMDPRSLFPHFSDHPRTTPPCLIQWKSSEELVMRVFTNLAGEFLSLGFPVGKISFCKSFAPSLANLD